jgi:hypothetical protein
MLQSAIPTSCPLAALAVMLPHLDKVEPEMALVSAPLASEEELRMVGELAMAFGLDPTSDRTRAGDDSVTSQDE